jgi:phosphoglycolate phosphatase
MHLIVFDCDGTLVDSQRIIAAAMGRAFAHVGLSAPERAAILSIVGLSLDHAMARLAPALSKSEAGALVRAYRDAFGDLRSDPRLAEPLFPGARAALDALSERDDVLIGMATGKSKRGVAYLLQREGLRAHFATIQTADDHPSKPHPAMIARAIAETGVDPARTIVVGDTTFDVEMARAARAGAIGVGWGYHAPAALTAAGADPILAHFDELLPHLKSRWARAVADA